VGYIVEGVARHQIERGTVQTLPVGSAFHEPAETVIANVGNASLAAPMVFVAFYLLDCEQELIPMMDSSACAIDNSPHGHKGNGGVTASLHYDGCIDSGLDRTVQESCPPGPRSRPNISL
jgi:hypothetical protein